ncbi:MAG: hypothetical protein R3B81_11825 [bacterium]
MSANPVPPRPRRDRVWPGFRSRPFVASVLAVGLLVPLATGCGDDSAGPTPDETPIELTISLGATSAGPGDRIPITGLPADEVVWAAISTGGDGHVVAFLERAGAGRGGDQLIVPFFPDDPGTGGGVQVRITNGSNITSNLVNLQIDALPPAPGAFAAVVADLQMLLDSWLLSAATTRAELTSTPPADLPITDLNLLFLHNLIDNPVNPNSLAAFAAGEIPMFAGESIDRDLLDAMIGASGLAGLVAEKTALADTLGGPPDSLRAESVRALRPLPRLDRGCFEGPTFGAGPDDCDWLSEAMQYQSELATAAAAAATRVEQLVQGVVLAGLSLTPAAPYATAAGAILWAAATIEDASIGIYPSHLLSGETDFVADPEAFAEDFTADGAWSEFRITAMSDGWNADRAVLEGLLQILGAVGSGPGDIADALGDQVDGAALEAFEGAITGYVKNQATTAALQEIVGSDQVDLQFCPQTWSGFDCTGAPYSVGTSSNESVLQVNDAAQSYRPVDVGSAQLRVETITGAFGNAHTAEDKVITTNPIEVHIDPFQARVGTDELVNFTVRVENAENTDVEWSSTGADFVWNAKGASLTTPSSPWTTPIEVRARSVANTGLREDGLPIREGLALVEYQDSLVVVNVTPRYDCISNDSTLVLTAEVIGVDDASVTWSIAEGWGTVQSTGPLTARYTPPSSGTTDDIVRATVVDHEEAIGDAHVRVSACTCFFDIMITGGINWLESGGDIAYVAAWGDGSVYAIQFFVMVDNPDGTVLGASVGTSDDQTAPQPGETGDWRMNLAVSRGGSLFLTDQSDDETAVFLTIDHATQTTMEGRMHGTIASRDQQGNIVSTALVDIPFRAGLFEGGWPCQ